MKFRPNAKVEEIRRRTDHPIVDSDAHQLETVPVLLDYLRDVGGSNMPDRFLAFIAHQRRTFEMTPDERLDTRTAMPVWWPIPTENTLDRATTQLPRLIYERLDEFGFDFGIVYPGIGLQIITLPGMADEELRLACARAFNTCYADLFGEFADRLTPAAVIPMHTPEEAVAELEYAVDVLGLKAAVFAGDVLRPVPRFAREHPELASEVQYQDCFGPDSPYDYDPVWAKCVELGIAPTSHSGPIGRGSRCSPTRHQYNQIGGFAEGGEALLKALWFGGVTRRFPTLNVGFLEGGAAWACSTFTRVIDHWKKRNAAAIGHLDPARLDQQLFGKLIDDFGHEKIQAYRDPLVENSLWMPSPEELDDWRACEVSTVEELAELFLPRFFFGCEGDDRMNAVAFDTKLNPLGSRLRAMFGSDIGHFDVVDMRDVLGEAWELVEDELIDLNDFKDFVFRNAVKLHGGMNPDFFKGTVVEDAAAQVLQDDA
ncbi:MAG: amidohydrolase family protein [Deltaproteobacteria bacterium]|nr:amidohydrolase family protein [Deltaproteobacteria bacterium]MBW2361553.1 amidohydrolase family protein [Deltaproteobacteria bacterium]